MALRRHKFLVIWALIILYFACAEAAAASGDEVPRRGLLQGSVPAAVAKVNTTGINGPPEAAGPGAVINSGASGSSNAAAAKAVGTSDSPAASTAAPTSGGYSTAALAATLILPLAAGAASLLVWSL